MGQNCDEVPVEVDGLVEGQEDSLVNLHICWWRLQGDQHVAHLQRGGGQGGGGGGGGGRGGVGGGGGKGEYARYSVYRHISVNHEIHTCI